MSNRTSAYSIPPARKVSPLRQRMIDDMTVCLEFTHTLPADRGGVCDYGVEGFLNGVEISLDPDSGIAYRK